ncbi:hypothetical protein KZ483_27285 [Paenibacillus sp. sptzw28]|uniref:hypothetical protein n=1 Tax=Paenibacillus sp. sptzw28 TaxID=715179 RepID=UPI001C6F2D0C|nr:hypothetical protein [Paenibacillus sp. sptzw28]QYR21333.1 hypothetical protein KZ483_27285 [Paenibacillus sp. sptzw28]
MMTSITFKKRSVPVHYSSGQRHCLELLHRKLKEMDYNFDFCKKWRRIASVELVYDVAILQYNDGTKLYLEVC